MKQKATKATLKEYRSHVSDTADNYSSLASALRFAADLFAEQSEKNRALLRFIEKEMRSVGLKRKAQVLRLVPKPR